MSPCSLRSFPHCQVCAGGTKRILLSLVGPAHGVPDLGANNRISLHSCVPVWGVGGSGGGEHLPHRAGGGASGMPAKHLAESRAVVALGTPQAAPHSPT